MGEDVCGGGRNLAVSLWETVSAGHYRLLYALQTDTAVVQLRLRVPRMPMGLYVVYRIYGIEQKDSWWRATDYNLKGTLLADEADAMFSSA